MCWGGWWRDAQHLGSTNRVEWYKNGILNNLISFLFLLLFLFFGGGRGEAVFWGMENP